MAKRRRMSACREALLRGSSRAGRAPIAVVRAFSNELWARHACARHANATLQVRANSWEMDCRKAFKRMRNASAQAHSVKKRWWKRFRRILQQQPAALVSYAHGSIPSSFRNGTILDDAIEAVRNGDLTINKFPALDVVKQNGKIIAVKR